MSVNQPGDVAYGFSQALLGVPSKPILAQRSPTTNDKAQIGTTWINQASNLVFIITSIVDNVANWVQTDSSASINEVETDSGNAFPIAGVIRVFGGANINTAGAGDTVTVNLNDDVDLPATNAGGTQGVYQIGGANFLFGYGPTNTFVGGNAGNTTLNPVSALHNVGVGNNTMDALTTGPNNTGVGAEALGDATTGQNNVAVGYLSLAALTSGESNISLGNQSLQNLVTGNDNIAIGFAAGSAYNGAQSSNILLGNPGVISDEHVMRLGDEGGGVGQVAATFIAAVYPNQGIGPTNTVVFIDNAGQAGTFPDADGEVIIGSSSGSPIWNTLTAGTDINIINGPNSITIESTVPQAIETIDGNAGTISGATVTIEGGNNITTTGDNATTMTVSVTGTTNHAIQLGNSTGSLTSLGVATNGQLPIGSTGANPVLATITPGTGINITNAAGSITIDCTVPAGIQTIDGDTGSATGATITFTGAPSGESVTFSAAGSTVDLHLTDSSLRNTFLGLNAGKTGVSGNLNSSLGYASLASITSGGHNTAVGYQAMTGLTDGSNNTAIGYSALAADDGNKSTAIGESALGAITAGFQNTAIGYAAGSAYTGAEQSNIIIGNDGTLGDANKIRIGTQGSGTGQQDSCFIAGIGGVTPGGSPEFVIIDPATGELGSTAGGGGSVTIDGDSGSATGSTITFTGVAQAPTVAFSATGSTVTLDFQDGSNNIVIGAGSTAGSGDNVGIGFNVFTGSTSSFQSTVVGFNALRGPGGTGNTAMGVGALESLTFSGSYTTTLGYVAGANYAGSETSNLCLGSQGVLGENNTIRIGDQGTGNAQQNSCFIAGIGGVTPGGTPQFVIIDPATGELGSTAGGGSGITTIAGNVGSATGSTVTFDATSNCGSSWSFEAAGSVITMIVEDTNSSIFMGEFAGNNTGTGDQNIGIGHGAFLNFTTATGNAAVGYNSFLNVQDSDNNAAFGAFALTSLTTGGGQNVAMGYAALGNLVSGSFNVAIGDNAGQAYSSTESNNIAIGSGGTNGDTGVISIGSLGTHTTCFIQGIAGVTVSNDAPVLIDTTTGQLGTVASSRRYKENISDIEDESQRLLELRPVRFNYKNDTSRETRYGLIAEEVEGVFPDLVVYNKDRAPETVRYHEIPALLIAELQRQHAIITDLSRRLERLETRGTYESKA